MRDTRHRARFEPTDRVAGRDVLFLASFESNDATLSQLHALSFLAESALVASLTVLLAFLPTGTMERYLQPGRIPAANTLAKVGGGRGRCSAPLAAGSFVHDV